MPENDGAIHKEHRKRMRKRFRQQGFDGFAEHEILEMLLYYAIPRHDTNPLAHRILDEYKTLANVFDADVQDLSKIYGLSEQSATLLTMIPHLAKAYEKSKYERNTLLHDTESIGRFALSMLNNKTKEEFALICVDANRKVHWSGIIATGSNDQINTTPRDIVSEVLRHNAKYVIFAHNHPNGSILPSDTDKNTTRTLCDLLNCIGVKTIDHIIVSQNRYYSLKETGFTF